MPLLELPFQPDSTGIASGSFPDDVFLMVYDGEAAEDESAYQPEQDLFGKPLISDVSPPGEQAPSL